MNYLTYQMQSDLWSPARLFAEAAAARWSSLSALLPQSLAMKKVSAAYALIARTGLSHGRPDFGIETVTVSNREVAIAEEVVHATPFGSLLHFKKDLDTPQPRVLLVAPMSGHFATLLRNTVKTMLPDHDLYVTDWHNARDVPLSAGRFDFDDFVDHVIEFISVIGPGAHVVAICQPSVPVLAAVALMAQDNYPDQPRSMTLMGGPIDTRVNPTKVNELGQNRSIDWFERNLIGTVPPRFAGAGRKVYPGFVQLGSFVSMNLSRHLKAHVDLFYNLVDGETDKAHAVRSFYDEYFAVMDLPAEFYLQTVRLVFQDHALPLGQLEVRGRKIDPSAISRTALLTVEGEKDDICALGQTLAAQELCSGLKPYLKRHYVQLGVGHYGVFSGRRWANEIYPIVRSVITQRD
jgi:poly(3-hydroxybutyrate) depolymerase